MAAEAAAPVAPPPAAAAATGLQAAAEDAVQHWHEATIALYAAPTADTVAAEKAAEAAAGEAVAAASIDDYVNQRAGQKRNIGPTST